MNTCKAAMRIIWRHKLYLLIYMVGLGSLMLVMGSSAITSASTPVDASTSFEQTRPRIAVINTDGGKLGEGLRQRLATSSKIVTLSEDKQSLQDAVARNDVDLIVVIPHGYSQRFEQSATTGDQPPSVESTVSYTSGLGSLAKIDVDGYFTQVRNVLHAQQHQDLDNAVDITLEHTSSTEDNADIQVVKSSTQSSRLLANGFGLVMKLSIYPLFTALTVCVSLLIGIFNTVETKRRITASPVKSYALDSQQLLASLIIGLVCWLFYTLATVALTMPHNPGFSVLSISEMSLPIITLLVFTFVAIAFGYMLGQFSISSSAANGVSVVMGMVLMFTSGAAFDPSVMPKVMIMVGKLTPGWWFSASIDHALGISTASSSGYDIYGWLQSLGVMATFGLAFLCIGLAIGRFKVSHPVNQTQKTTRLTELG
ncbi:MAG: ABC transporter permease [Bifidobacterium sp.]|nr:ABC transporter permease [Bifidobacterium sp.]MCH4175035.1 ABC transporter permease [Bifidobacterium sp.]